MGGVKVKLDIRVVGDRYYDDTWARDMLTRRVQGHVPDSQAFSVSPTDLLFSLVYHVLVHKWSIAKDYPGRLCAQARGLGYSNIIISTSSNTSSNSSNSNNSSNNSNSNSSSSFLPGYRQQPRLVL